MTPVRQERGKYDSNSEKGRTETSKSYEKFDKFSQPQEMRKLNNI